MKPIKENIEWLVEIYLRTLIFGPNQTVAEYQFPRRAVWACAQSAKSFADLAIMSGVDPKHVSIWWVSGRTGEWDFCDHAHNPKRDLLSFMHCVTQVGDWFVDFTARQMGVNQPFPLIAQDTDFLAQHSFVVKADDYVPQVWAPQLLPVAGINVHLEEECVKYQNPVEGHKLAYQGFETWHTTLLPQDFVIRHVKDVVIPEALNHVLLHTFPKQSEASD